MCVVIQCQAIMEELIPVQTPCGEVGGIGHSLSSKHSQQLKNSNNVHSNITVML